MFGRKKKLKKEIVYVGDFAEVKQLMKSIGFEYYFDTLKYMSFKRETEHVEISKETIGVMEYRNGFNRDVSLTIEDLTQIIKALQVVKEQYREDK